MNGSGAATAAREMIAYIKREYANAESDETRAALLRLLEEAERIKREGDSGWY